MPGDERFRVVIADDVEDLRLAFRVTLELSGRFTVVAEAADGEQAVRSTEEAQPDLLLLDVSMPDLDGMEVLPLVREKSPHTIVVMLSGFNAPRLAPMAIQRGAAKYLEKGLSPDALVLELLSAMGASDRTPRGVLGAAAARTPSIPETAPDELVAAVAHELRNGLTALQSISGLLATRAEELPSATITEMNQRMFRRSRHLDGVVRSMLMLPAIEAGDLLLEISRQEVVPLLRQIVDDLQDLLGTQELKTTMEEYLGEVQVDPERLQQVLTNVVANAVKHSPPRGTIRLTARRMGTDLLMLISDEGPGIPVEYREKVFEKFMQVDRSRSTIGVGLYVARALMTAMNGRIWILDSNKGTTVCCTLPLVQ